jgi:hypothetical protein
LHFHANGQGFKGGIVKRGIKAGLVLSALLTGLLSGGAPAFGQTPSGGTIQLWGTPNNSGGGPVVLTGAIGDSGKSANANSSGVPGKKGTYELLTLKKGKILLNTTQLDKNANGNNVQPTTFSSTTCSGTFVVTDPVPVVSGTKAYSGIGGTVNVTVTFAIVLPLTNGKCNTNTNANPIAMYGSISGSGTVSFG